MKSLTTYKNFDEYWPDYLSEHSDPLNRGFHFLGISIVHLILLYVFATADFKILWLVPFVSYFFAWIGHSVIEKNPVSIFKFPLWSLRGDFKMFYHILFKKL